MFLAADYLAWSSVVNIYLSIFMNNTFLDVFLCYLPILPTHLFIHCWNIVTIGMETLFHIGKRIKNNISLVSRLDQYQFFDSEFFCLYLRPSKPVASAKPAESQDELPISDDGNWTHCKLDWLRPEKIRDAMKRKPDDPDYDPRTLYVPPEFLKTQTPVTICL